MLFLKKFLTEGSRIAAVAPSSRAMAHALCVHVHGDRPQTIVELGAGTGAVTREAARRMHPESQLLAVERDVEFMARLRQTAAAGVEPVQGDVVELDSLLTPRLPQAGRVDLVLSGLPVPSLPNAANRSLFHWFSRLPGTPWWSQLTVMPWVYKPLYERLFEEVRFQLVLANLPVGGVYHCRSLRPGFLEHLPGGK